MIAFFWNFIANVPQKVGVRRTIECENHVSVNYYLLQLAFGNVIYGVLYGERSCI
jgi:hypothetical protein